MWCFHEFLLGDLPIFVGVQGIKSLLASHHRSSTLTALTLTATLGKCHTSNEKHSHQSNQNNKLEMFHFLSFLLQWFRPADVQAPISVA